MQYEVMCNMQRMQHIGIKIIIETNELIIIIYFVILYTHSFFKLVRVVKVAGSRNVSWFSDKSLENNNTDKLVHHTNTSSLLILFTAMTLSRWRYALLYLFIFFLMY